ncbi:MAG: hypothetical protein HUU54_05770 [Ignavibacteriaceae bacterium]|nr:hypothetical protein [Ignavibacteriaceae bacterium]
MKKYIALFLIAILFQSCKNSNEPNEVNSKPKKVVRIGVDFTGSYHLFENGKDDLMNSLDNLPPGSTIILRELSGNSYGSSNLIETFIVPDISGGSINPFSRKAKLKSKIENAHIDSIRQMINERCSIIKSKNYSRTDIDGFLLYCKENINLNDDNIIILISDLEQNVETFSKYLESMSLAGVAIHILSFESKRPETRKLWEDNFSKLGANYIFHEPGQSINFN